MKNEKWIYKELPKDCVCPGDCPVTVDMLEILNSSEKLPNKGGTGKKDRRVTVIDYGGTCYLACARLWQEGRCHGGTLFYYVETETQEEDSS